VEAVLIEFQHCDTLTYPYTEENHDETFHQDGLACGNLFADGNHCGAADGFGPGDEH
jgi:hypothetical protein